MVITKADRRGNPQKARFDATVTKHVRGRARYLDKSARGSNIEARKFCDLPWLSSEDEYQCEECRRDRDYEIPVDAS